VSAPSEVDSDLTGPADLLGSGSEGNRPFSFAAGSLNLVKRFPA
jgi:hypothetical protein